MAYRQISFKSASEAVKYVENGNDLYREHNKNHKKNYIKIPMGVVAKKWSKGDILLIRVVKIIIPIELRRIFTKRGFKFTAVNEDGKVFIYTSEPHVRKDRFTQDNGEPLEITPLLARKPFNINWTDSLSEIEEDCRGGVWDR